VDDRNLRVADFAQFWATAKVYPFFFLATSAMCAQDDSQYLCNTLSYALRNRCRHMFHVPCSLPSFVKHVQFLVMILYGKLASKRVEDIQY